MSPQSPSDPTLPGDPPGYGYIPVPQAPRRRLAAAISYAVVAAVAACAGGLAVALTSSSGSPPSASAGLSPGSSSAPGTEPGAAASSDAGISGAALQGVQNAVRPGLVVINSSLQDDGPDVYGAAGTGMIISRSGLVLTNNHVIDGTNGLTATVVATGKTYPAIWLGYDKGSDIAVIKLEGASGLTPVPLGNSSAARVGDGVVVMGNAGGTGSITTATGAITGLNLPIMASDEGGGDAEHLTGMIRTDADIIQGDSGGPLVTTAGQVIGMDTASNSGDMASQRDVGFAIPINKAMTVARQIITDKPGPGVRVGATGFVGVLVPSGPNGQQSTAANPNRQLQQEEQQSQTFGQSQVAPNTCVTSDQNPGIPAKVAPVSSGTLVLGALCQTPAADAGMIPGDVIVKVNSQTISSPSSLMTILQKIPGGKSITLTWVTPNDQTVTKSLTLSSAPPQ